VKNLPKVLKNCEGAHVILLGIFGKFGVLRGEIVLPHLARRGENRETLARLVRHLIQGVREGTHYERRTERA
jgi:hypothetical protein